MLYCINFTRWKQRYIDSFLEPDGETVFISSAANAIEKGFNENKEKVSRQNAVHIVNEAEDSGKANYAQAYSFKYSPRPGTPAASMDDQIAPELMDERLQRLQALLNEQQHDFNKQALGRRTDILLERNGKLNGQLVGKTPWLQSVHIIAPELKIGDMVDVTIESAGPNSLQGRLTQKEAA